MESNLLSNSGKDVKQYHEAHEKFQIQTLPASGLQGMRHHPTAVKIAASNFAGAALKKPRIANDSKNIIPVVSGDTAWIFIIDRAVGWVGANACNRRRSGTSFRKQIKPYRIQLDWR